MRDSGVITGFRMDVDPAALGKPVTAFARIRPTAGQLPRIADLAAELPEVAECYRITGEDCFLIKLHAASLVDLEAVLDRFLMFGQTVTSIVVSTPVPPRPLPIDAESEDGSPQRRSGRRAGSVRHSRRAERGGSA
jgi:Lrp/AsnC family leucine-responsive transcriptional regulator